MSLFYGKDVLSFLYEYIRQYACYENRSLAKPPMGSCLHGSFKL